MQKTKQQPTVTLITRGSDPLMEQIRDILAGLQARGEPLNVITSSAGDVYGAADVVAVFTYDERTMRTSGRQAPIRKRSSCLCVGYMTSLYDRLEMDTPTWAPNATLFIALWPEQDTTNLRDAIAGAVRTVRKSLRVMATPKGPSKKRQRTEAFRKQRAATKASDQNTVSAT